MPNERTRLIYAANHAFMYGPKNQAVQVEFAAADGKRFKLSIQRTSLRERNRRLEHPENEIVVRRDGIAYIRVARFDSDFMSEVERRHADWKDARALVVDVRRVDGSPFAAYRMARCLLAKPFESLPMVFRQNRTSDRLAGGNSERFVSTLESVEPDPGCQYRKPVYLLISEETAFPGEILARLLKRAGRATVVGQPPLDATTSMPVRLPGGGYAFYAAAMLAAADGSPERSSVQPDVEAHQGVSDYRQGVDTALESTIARALRETKN